LKPMVTTITGIIRRITTSFRLAAITVLAVAATGLLIGVTGSAGAATAATATPVPLGTAANFAVMGATVISAYTDAATEPVTATIPTELGGTTVTPGCITRPRARSGSPGGPRNSAGLPPVAR
jgi:hypothetical protein